MSNGYIGLAIGNSLDVTTRVVIDAQFCDRDVNNNAIPLVCQATTNYRTSALKNSAYTQNAVASATGKSSNFFTGKYTQTATATVSGVGAPIRSAKYTQLTSVTIFIDAETTGQAAFAQTCTATTNVQTSADKEAYGASEGSCDVVSINQTEKNADFIIAGSSTSSANGTTLLTRSNIIGTRSTYAQITNTRARSANITTSTNRQNVITTEQDAA